MQILGHFQDTQRDNVCERQFPLCIRKKNPHREPLDRVNGGKHTSEVLDIHRVNNSSVQFFCS